MEAHIYAGIAGIESDVESYELGHGIILKRTFAHFMSPFLMAFKEAEGGKPHPGPWSAVRGGREIDIHLELYIPAEFNLPNFFNRINTAWWIISLIRLRGYYLAHVPTVANRPFSEIPKSATDPIIVPVEMLVRQAIPNQTLTNLTNADLDWIKQVWIPGAKLMRENQKFNAAFRLIDHAGFLPYKPLSLLSLWGALEQLFSSSSHELRFRISAYIAAYLYPAGISRLRLYRSLSKQYDTRCKVAHGEIVEVNHELEFMYKITQTVVEKILLTGHVPTKDEIENLLFMSPEK